MGISEARRGFSFARLRPAMHVLIASISGEGEALVEGRWHGCHAGTAYVAPASMPHAYRARAAWRIVWVTYEDSSSTQPLFSIPHAVLTRMDPRPLEDCVRNIYQETTARSQAPVLSLWVDLLHALTVRSIRRQPADDRLQRLWEVVDARLDSAWTLPALAHECAMSTETLRRHCRRHHGCSPMKQVARLRMRRASGQIASTSDKLDAIARSVGYSDVFSFSSAFKRQMGVAPSTLRSR